METYQQYYRTPFVIWVNYMPMKIWMEYRMVQCNNLFEKSESILFFR